MRLDPATKTFAVAAARGGGGAELKPMDTHDRRVAEGTLDARYFFTRSAGARQEVTAVHGGSHSAKLMVGRGNLQGGRTAPVWSFIML
jgi:hypothetical protein